MRARERHLSALYTGRRGSVRVMLPMLPLRVSRNACNLLMLLPSNNLIFVPTSEQ